MISDDTLVDKNEVIKLLDNYSVRKIESSVVKHFIDDIDISDDSYIYSFIENVSEDDSEEIVEGLVKRDKMTLLDVLRVFELCNGPDDRDLNGIYYTPNEITQYIIDNTVDSNDKVFDFACGGGAFLLNVAQYLYKNQDRSAKNIIEEQIYGADIMKNNVRQSKIILLLFAASKGESIESINFNIVQCDSLQNDWSEVFQVADDGFDAVVGNPPYIKIQSLSEELKKTLSQNYKTVGSGNFNLYMPFMELSLTLINDDGKVGLITPLNYFTTLTGEGLREHLQSNKFVRKIVDFGERLLFDDALIYTAITIMDKKRKSYIEYVRLDEDSPLEALYTKNKIKINYSSLNPKKWRLLTEQEYKNIEKIESFRPLDDISDIRTGIATLKDAVYTIENASSKGDYYHKKFEGNNYLIEKDVTRELVKISQIDDEKDLENNNRRIIFPYEESGDSEFSLIPEADFKSDYPKAYEYLEAAKEKLATREKGDGADYEPWYKYGRKQGIEYSGERLYIGTYSDGPQFKHHTNKQALFCNGYAIFPDSDKVGIKVLKAVLKSDIMDYYMRKTSKDIQGGYQCYQKNFIRTFSVPEFSEEEKYKLVNSDSEKINQILREKYDVNLSNN